MKYPKVTYNHLPVPLACGQHYISEIPSLDELEIDNYLAVCWPRKPQRLIDNYNNLTLNERINNRAYYREIVRYTKERNRLLADRQYAFISAYTNLVVFDVDGNVVPIEQQKYCNL